MTRQARREAGVVSIMVTMVMMIVITLIVLGFADIARNEQRSSLDSQLSAQAFYAAESGVNDARAAMAQLVADGQSITDKTTCGDQNPYTTYLTQTVDAAHNVSYTCVLIDAAPSSLNYNIGYTSTVIPLLSDGASFGNLKLSWTLPSGSPSGSSAADCYPGGTNPNTFPLASGGGAWTCDYPVVRVDLLDANASSLPFVRTNWNNITATMFFVPFKSGGMGNASMADHGTAIGTACDDATDTCTAKITSLNGTKYYMRVTTLYQTNSTLTITASGANFTGTQATIDSTGKAQDVLRRIRVAVDLTDANSQKVPGAALIVKDSVCKRFGVTDGSFDVYDDMTAGAAGNPQCRQQSGGTPIL